MAEVKEQQIENLEGQAPPEEGKIKRERKKKSRSLTDYLVSC